MPFFARRARYRLQHRYQDSGWEDSDDEEFAADRLGDAVRFAEERSRHALLWGMCRVVELSSGMVIVEFPAGHPAYRIIVANGRVMLAEESGHRIGGVADGEGGDWSEFFNALGGAVEQCLPGDHSFGFADLSSSSSLGPQHPDTERVTATGPDLPAIENRAPRGIRLRNRESKAN